ncbi:MAG: YcgL domain-containing protein [Thiogranum sp.]
MRCVVYKSLRQFDYYLYVKKADGFTRLPDGLKQILGVLEKVIELDLDERRTLARADVVEVMQQIEAKGYFLQMPPRVDGVSTAS